MKRQVAALEVQADQYKQQVRARITWIFPMQKC